jgi:hypothetical protein
LRLLASISVPWCWSASASGSFCDF